MIKVTDSLGNEVINRFDANGMLWQVADSSGFSLKSAIIGGAASVLSGVSQAAEFLDAIDPTRVIFNIPSTGPQCCVSS